VWERLRHGRVTGSDVAFEREPPLLPETGHIRIFVMNIHIKSTLAAALLLSSAGIAVAQDVVIVPEQRTVIREYVQKKPLMSVDLPGIELNIGSSVPKEVELHAIEAPDIQYRYVNVNNRTLVVDPATNTVVEIIE
jgi:hypothetical protein